jgi:hypothetical protein
MLNMRRLADFPRPHSDMVAPAVRVLATAAIVAICALAFVIGAVAVALIVI